MNHFENLNHDQSTNNFRSESDLYQFKNRLDDESYKRLVGARDKIFLQYSQRELRNRIISSRNIWEQKPVDFSRKLYDPHPPKRNTREAIRPWTYDKFLRAPGDESIFWEKEEDKKKANEQMVDELFLVDSLENWQDFDTYIRVQTPQGARMHASKNMSFRENLDQYQIPKDHDFRPLEKHIYGLPDFQVKSEKDPQNIKFKIKNLNIVNGLSDGTCLRDMQDDHQMGDLVKKKDLRYNPKLILPRLQFPTKYDAYTRFKTNNASADDAYWERLIPKLNMMWKENK